MRLLLTSLFAVAALVLTGCPTPDGIVFDAVDAARDGDREGLLACFTERSRPVLGAYWDIVDVHRAELGTLTARDVQIESVTMRRSTPFDPVHAHVTIREGGQRLKLVVHATGAAWRIDLLDTERALMDFNE